MPRTCPRKLEFIFQRLRFDEYNGWPFDASLGYPGEGPAVKRRVRNPRGNSPTHTQTPTATPTPVTPASTTTRTASAPSTDRKRKRPGDNGRPGNGIARRSMVWLLGLLLPRGMQITETPLQEEGCLSVLRELNRSKTNAAYYRRKFEEEASEAPDPRGGCRGPSLNVSTEHGPQRQRVRLICRDMYRALSDRPESDQALAVNELVETYLTREVRLRLREHTFVERERYVGIRAAVYELREKYWTAENWLELRLTRYIASGVFRLGHKIFSMVQDSDGVWERQVLVPTPSNKNRAKQDHIFGPLPVPSPFRHHTAVAAAQAELLKHHEFDISEDGKCAVIDIFGAAQSAHAKAVQNNNYDSASPPRIQTQCDAVGYFRGGRQATRHGVRIVNVERNHNSKYYFSNVALFLGADHYAELNRYLASLYEKINACLRTAPTGTDAKGNEQFSASLFTDKVCGGCDFEIIDGGDAACANASSNLEPPPSKRGCCFYCTLRRPDWFNRGRCSKATRRTLFNTSLFAHRLPPGAPKGARYVCPAKGCDHVITAESEAAMLAQRAKLNDKQLSARDLGHRNTHTGVFEGRLKLQHQDNIKRAPSLLHFNLNSTSSTLVVCFKAGATEAQLVAVNAALAKHHTNYKFKLGKKTRDSKADGEVCKRILWKRGLLMDMVHARWGPPTTPGARAADRDLDAAGADGGHLQEGDDQPLPPPAPRPPAPPVANNLDTSGLDLDALLAASTNPPPAPPPATPPTAADAADDSEDAADAGGADLELQDDEVEAVADTCGTRDTATDCLLALLKFNLELHTPWAFKDRAAHSSAAQKKGTIWAETLRRHSNGSVGHYYSHVAFAHLEELLEEHGHLQPVNDEVLEKGNRDMKRFRDLTYHGGDSSKEGQATLVEQKRYRLLHEARNGVEAVYEEHTVKVPRHHASWIECMKMQVAADLLVARRPYHGALKDMGKRNAAKKARRAARDGVKAEAIALMDQM